MSDSARFNDVEQERAHRIVQVLDHLGIEKAHFAAQRPEDWVQLATTYPGRIASLTLVCPEKVDAEKLKAFSARLLVISGDQPPFAEHIAKALHSVSDVNYVALKGYENLTWNDPISDHTDTIRSSVFDFLENVSRDTLQIMSGSSDTRIGSIADVSFQTQGSGEPLVLLPLGLSPSQWENILPTLRQRYFVVSLTGPELGILPLIEHRGRSAGYQRLLRNMFTEIQLKPGDTVLDIGCGTAVVGRWLAHHTAKKNPIVGIDINPYLLHEASALVRQERLEQTIRLQEGNAQSLPFEDASFDVVTATTVMEEVDADAMLAEMVRVTKPAGRVGVIVRALDLPRSTSVPAHPALKQKYEAPQNWGMSATGCAGADLYRRFRQIGLTNVCVAPDWTVFCDVNGVVERELQKTMGAELEPHEAREWRAATEQSVRDGTFFMTWPHHCAVGTKEIM